MLKETADALTEEAYKVTIVENYRDYLLRKKQRKHDYDISQLNLFTMIRISKEVLDIDDDLLNATLINASMKVLGKNGEGMIKIIAFAVLNNRSKPSKKLLAQISLMTSDDLLRIVQVILKQMNLKAFMTSIISISGVNVLEMNPKEQRS